MPTQLNFKKTLNLPKTEFPMRANLAQREPRRFAKWDASRLYHRILEHRSDGADFILHDGPPYANGEIHMGHALNKILKDVIVRYKSMRGFHAPYVPGWDCHGLPIEQQVLKEIGPRIHEMEPGEVRRLCQQYAEKYIDIQRRQFKRLGILGDWDSPYLTIDPEFEAGILRCLRDLVSRGLVRKGFKVVHWDPEFRTALAEAEIEYHERISDSIYVKFPILDPGKYPVLENLQNPSLVIWTTTPWTLPANLGVCLHPAFKYVAIAAGDETYIVAKDLAIPFLDACEITGGESVKEFTADILHRAQCAHPVFDDRSSLVMLAEHVTLEQGTGCVHTAPGHGTDDFAIGRKYGLPVVVPVDARGRFSELYPEMEGVPVFDANPKIIANLEITGRLLKATTVAHDYPFSWRSKKPVIFRATEQWFLELGEGDIRNKALKEIDESVQWIPGWGYDRIRAMVSNRPDWCLSRQRSWGVPIPAIRSRKTGESILDQRVIEKFIQMVAHLGTNCWFELPIEEFLPDGFVYEKTGESKPGDFEKEYDILDVWFDSGSSHIACLESDERLSSPADLYLEGSDQHRGWFQAALLTSVGTRDRAPFRAVLTHGFLLDGEGKAMSKSAGNIISPRKIVDKIGSDILRLWVMSVDYRSDARVSDEVISHVVDTYRSLRNTIRFQIGNLSDFDRGRDAVPIESCLPVDLWALHKTDQLLTAVTLAFEQYEFQRAYQLINRFCTVTLSATYHDLLKDRLYTFGRDSRERRSAQTVVDQIFEALIRVIAPVLVFTADEAFLHARGESLESDSTVHLQSWPKARNDWRNPEIASAIDKLLEIRTQVNEKLEILRQEKSIGQSLEASVSIFANPASEEFMLLKKFERHLAELFIVSRVSISDQTDSRETLRVEAEKITGERCPRCWRWLADLVDYRDESRLCARCRDSMDG